jgi:uncharacterized protein YndB with AHSA1/START domain
MSVHELVLEEDFGVPSSRLWSAITDHEGMSKWAGGDVRIVARGDASGVGVVRRISIGPLRIDEEVIYADAPRRLVYRVVRGIPVRFHRGEMVIDSVGEGRSHLSWRILVSARAPGLARAVTSSLGPPLRMGLRQLRGLIGG